MADSQTALPLSAMSPQVGVLRLRRLSASVASSSRLAVSASATEGDGVSAGHPSAVPLQALRNYAFAPPWVHRGFFPRSLSPSLHPVHPHAAIWLAPAARQSRPDAVAQECFEQQDRPWAWRPRLRLPVSSEVPGVTLLRGITQIWSACDLQSTPTLYRTPRVAPHMHTVQRRSTKKICC